MQRWPSDPPGDCRIESRTFGQIDIPDTRGAVTDADADTDADARTGWRGSSTRSHSPGRLAAPYTDRPEVRRARCQVPTPGVTI